MIRVEAVSKRFRERVVLDHVSLDVSDGATTVILGPSGIGKTVLLKIMAGLVRPDEGRVFHDGRRVHFGRFADKQEPSGGLGYVFQGGALFDSLTVAENVALVLEETTRLAQTEICERTDAALRRVGMVEHSGLYPRALSGGMTRLVAIARALVGDPRCVFFDEPTTGLDPAVRERVYQMMTELRERSDRSLVVVTHDLEAAGLLADCTYMLRAGKLVRADSVRKEHYEQAHS
ncbi:ATP-binding cassette domain-containing protein [candidate division WOR-3 bacterium]|uniref:ATP-binding cassette domain-containing protein n=1 Tax=candidate division WOR-3 bacterium TaxID=2052148 RepID=A0A938BSS0_UNCW3|nr:ATP-binding cassette domain-containing protein [candidate division WOR-3 bacterium]